MNTEPTSAVLEQLQDQADVETAAETARVIAGAGGDRPIVDEVADHDHQGDAETEQTIDIVVDGRTLSDAEVEALLQKPLEELTDAEREGLQPLFDAARAQQPQGVDVLSVASDVLQDAVASLMSKPPTARRLEHKIALGHALAALVQAQSTRNLMLLTQKQLQLVMQAQQAQVARAAGPVGIVIPQANVRLHG